MKKILLPLALLVAICATGQNKINLAGLAKLEQINAEAKSRAAAAEPVEAIVTMNDGWSQDLLGQYGAEITLSISDNMFIASIPADKILDFADNEQVYYVEFGREFRPMLDKARPASQITDIQNGFEYNGATISYTGKNIVTGLMDEGVDPNHPNFAGRVIAAYKLASNGSVTSATTPVTIARFSTDNEDATHGTHVLGIMAGSYKDKGQLPSSGSSTVDIPYYGVATDSKIVAAGGVLTETNIVKGVQNVIEQAKNAGLPVVVNLSLGSNDGPHDGSGSLEKSLTNMASDAIICISAGNEGAEKIFAGKKFTDKDTEFKTCILDNIFAGVDIWTNSSEPVTVTVSLYSTSTGKYTELATVDKAGQMASCSNVAFTNAMSGACSLSSEVNILNNRYHVMMNGSFQPKTSGNNVVITIKGKEGQQVYCYGYSKLASYPNTQFSSNRMSGFSDGTTDGSISDMACALNVIAVGAYTTRTSWPTFAGTYSYTAAANLKVDEVSSFSSYGTTYQGVELPVSCAPGANIISSLSRYYTKNLSASTRNQETSASVAGSGANDMTAYWGPMQGTSMSCPYLAGTMALWLEADPSLTVTDCVEILRETSILPETSIGGLPGVAGSSNKNKQWGGGRLDALEGIKEVIRRKDAAGIDNVMADGTGYVITPAGDRTFNIVVDGASRLEANIYNMQGVAVATATAAGNKLTIDAANVGHGAYILTVTAPNIAPVSKKITL